MVQEEVFNHLKENAGEWLTAKDISDNLDASIISVRMALKRLKQSNLVEAQQSTMRGNPFEYSFEKKSKVFRK